MDATIDDKISDDELRRRVHERSTEAASVIVEVDLPCPVTRMALRNGHRRSQTVEWRDRDAVEEQFAEAGEFLGHVLGHAPHPLRAAGSFVVEATGEQLATIAESTFTRRIAPNRVHDERAAEAASSAS